jgi:hypothetical protein
MSADLDSSPASRRSFVLAAAASGLSYIVPRSAGPSRKSRKKAAR